MKFDVCIRGGGIVGRTLALLLAQQRLKVALLVQPQATGASNLADNRAYAMNPSSKALLERVRAWAMEAATPVFNIEVLHAGARLDFTPPQAREPLHWIVQADALQAQLEAACAYQSNIHLVTDSVDAKLIVACEGKDSLSREAWGVEFDKETYPQHAIAARLRFSSPHRHTARQWFSGEHIVALLPLGGAVAELGAQDEARQEPIPLATVNAAQDSKHHEVALVWSAPADEVAQLLHLDEAAFLERLNAIVSGSESHSSFIAEGLISPRQHWPLSLGRARSWVGVVPGLASGQSHFALAGDAAHTIHPLAGQGLNLGLADARDLALCIEERDFWREVGDLKVLRRYARMRAAPTLGMARGCDALQALFSHPNPGLQKMRQWGLSAVNHIEPLKRELIRFASL